jgi:hypothetical protein
LPVVVVAEVEALGKYVEELRIASMGHKDVILTEPAEAAERNSPEETEVRLGQVYLQEDKPAPSVKEDKEVLGQPLQVAVEVVDTMAAEVVETTAAVPVQTAVVEVEQDLRSCLLVALALQITIRTMVMLPLRFQEVQHKLPRRVIVLYVPEQLFN